MRQQARRDISEGCLSTIGIERRLRPHAISAEERLLAWLIGLSDGVDPALAARQLLDALHPEEQNGQPQPRWLELLLEVTRYPAERVRGSSVRRQRASVKRS